MTEPVNNLTDFRYGPLHLRTLNEHGDVWFVAKDVAEILGLKWAGEKSLRSIPQEWRVVYKLYTTQTNQYGPTGTVEKDTILINEPAVYKLAFRSNKPEAERFTNWVAGEVLPALRKTGHYQVAAPPPNDGREMMRLPETIAKMSYATLKQMQEQPDIDTRRELLIRYRALMQMEMTRLNRATNAVIPEFYLEQYENFVPPLPEGWEPEG